MTIDILTAGMPAGNNNNRRLETEKKGTLQLKTANNNFAYRKLSFLSANKIIQKFLSCDRIVVVEERRLKYSREELAKILNIAPEDIEKLESPGFYDRIANKINFSLTTLYCSTKWVSEKCEDESIKTYLL